MTNEYDSTLYQYAYTQTFDPKKYKFDGDSNHQIESALYIIRGIFDRYNDECLISNEAVYRVTPEWMANGMIHFHGFIASEKSINLRSDLCNMLRELGRMTINRVKSQNTFNDYNEYCHKVSGADYYSFTPLNSITDTN